MSNVKCLASKRSRTPTPKMAKVSLWFPLSAPRGQTQKGYHQEKTSPHSFQPGRHWMRWWPARNSGVRHVRRALRTWAPCLRTFLIFLGGSPIWRQTQIANVHEADGFVATEPAIAVLSGHIRASLQTAHILSQPPCRDGCQGFRHANRRAALAIAGFCSPQHRHNLHYALGQHLSEPSVLPCLPESSHWQLFLLGPFCARCTWHARLDEIVLDWPESYARPH